MNKLLLHICGLFFLCATYAQGGNDLYDHRLNEKKWGELRDGIRYENQQDGAGREWTYENRQEFEKAQRESGGGRGSGGQGGNGERGGGSGNSGNGENGGGSSADRSSSSSTTMSSSVANGLGVLGYILLGAFIILLAFMIYYLFVNRERDGKKVGEALPLDEINPVEIPLSELQRLLQEALSKGDYRGAVRIYFIFIIRDLAEKKWIAWEKEKTNFHYLREMSGKNEFDDFNRSVSYFEIIWYGKRELDASKFDQIKPAFTRFLDKLGVK